MSAASSSVASSVGRTSVVVCVAVALSAVPTATTREGGSARVAAADAVGLVVSPAVDGEKTLLPDDPREAAAVESAFAVAPSLAATSTSGEGGVASVPAVDAAVAAASSAILRRMYERKEDMCPSARQVTPPR